jgi:hypothetical protein
MRWCMLFALQVDSCFVGATSSARATRPEVVDRPCRSFSRDLDSFIAMIAK